MTTDNQQPINTSSFGVRLKAAREHMGLEQKDAAAQLRLSEKYIVMMEEDNFSSDLPITFVRGYLRSYAKLLQIPAWEVQKALEPIQPKAIEPDPLATSKQTSPVTSGNYFMQLFTYLIVLTIVGLAGSWWYNHTPSHSNTTAELAPGTTTPLSLPLPNTAAEASGLTQASSPANPNLQASPVQAAALPTSAANHVTPSPIIEADNSAPIANKPTPSVKSQHRNDDYDDEPNGEETD